MASNTQWSFLGGIWSNAYQGRMDDEDYAVALAECFNSHPLDTGAWTRRGGTQWRGYYRNGQPANVLKFSLGDVDPLNCEFTDNNLRFWQSGVRVKTGDEIAVVSVSTATPAVVRTNGSNGWATGDQIEFLDGDPLLRNRVFAIEVIDADEFSITDAVTGEEIDGTGLEAPLTVARIRDISTPFGAGSWRNVRLVQADQTVAALLWGGKPQVLRGATDLSNPDGPPLLTLSPMSLKDGPYFDVIDTASVVPDAATGTINLQIVFDAYSATQVYDQGEFASSGGLSYRSLVDSNVNNTPASSPTFWEQVDVSQAFGQQGIVPGDIGRSIRLHSEPPVWAIGTTYAAGARVSYAGAYWISLAGSNLNVVPGSNPAWWRLAVGTEAHLWTWGRISALGGLVDNLDPDSSGIGDMIQGGGIAGARDGIIVQGYLQGAYKDNVPSQLLTNTTWSQNNSFFAWVGSNLANTDPVKIKSATIYKPTDAKLWQAKPIGRIGWFGDTDFFTINATPYFQLWGKVGATPPAGPNDGVLLGQVTWPSLQFRAGRFLSLPSPDVYAEDLGLLFPGLFYWGDWNDRTNQFFAGTQVPDTDVTIISNDQTTEFDHLWVVGGVVASSEGFGSGPNGYQFIQSFTFAEVRFNGTSAASTAGFSVDILGSPLLYTNVGIREWRLGVYADSTTYPKAGTYDDGRLWLTGAVKNRFDASKSNDIFDFAPTESDGTVTARNGISYTLNSKEANDVFWMEPDDRGIVCGTAGGEWLIRAPAPGSVSPTNIEAKPVTKAKCANVEPARTEHTLTFIQKDGRAIREHFMDVNSSVFIVKPLSHRVKPLLRDGIVQLEYILEPTPILWAITNGGELLGTTYRRTRLSTVQEPDYNAWHRHLMGDDQFIIGILGSQVDGADKLLLGIRPDTTAERYGMIEMEPVYETERPLLLDTALQPLGKTEIAGGIRLHGFHHLIGQSVAVFAASLDCGDYTVSASGTVDVPYGNGVTGGTAQGRFTQAVANSNIPIWVGKPFTSDAQRLRPVTQQDTGTRNGLLAFGKSRRTHEWAGLFSGLSEGLQIGGDFDNLRTVKLTRKGGKKLTNTEEFTGILKDTLDDDFGFDSMLSWRMARTTWGIVSALAGFLKTQDK